MHGVRHEDVTTKMFEGGVPITAKQHPQTYDDAAKAIATRYPDYDWNPVSGMKWRDVARAMLMCQQALAARGQSTSEPSALRTSRRGRA